MKKVFSIPLVLLMAALVVACGKSKDGGVAVVPAPVQVPPAPIPTPVPGPDISQWCYNQGGSYSGGICRLQHTTNFGWNRYTGYNISVGVNVYFNDTVVVSGNDIKSANVGGISYPLSFVANSQGTLLLSGHGLFDLFEVNYVQITRCYNSSGYGVRCP